MNSYRSHSVLSHNDLYLDGPPSNFDPLCWVQAIRDPVVNMDQYNAKNIIVTQITLKAENYLLIAGDSEPFEDAEHIRNALATNTQTGDKGSMGSGGSNAHRLLSVDPYDAKAIWASRTNKDGNVAISSQVGSDRRIHRERLKYEKEFFSVLDEKLTKIKEDPSKMKVFVLMKTFTKTNSRLSWSLACLLDVVMPPLTAICKVQIQPADSAPWWHQITGRQKYLEAAPARKFSINDVEFDTKLNDGTEARLSGNIHFYLYPGWGYFKHVWHRTTAEGYNTNPYSTMLDYDGFLTLPFIDDKTMQRAAISPVCLWPKLYANINSAWGTNIDNIKDGIKTGIKRETKHHNEREIRRKPHIIVHIELGKFLEASKTVGTEIRRVDNQRFLSEAFRINKFFSVSEMGRNNCNKIVLDLLRAAKDERREEVNEIVKACMEEFPEQEDRLAPLPRDVKITGARDDIYLFGEDGKKLPRRLDYGSKFTIAYFKTASGNHLKEFDYVPFDPSWTITRRDIGGYDISISGLKIQDGKKLRPLTVEEWLKTEWNQGIVKDGITYPKAYLSFINPETGRRYRLAHQVVLPRRHEVKEHTREKEPTTISIGEAEDNSRWYIAGDERVYVTVENNLVKYSKKNPILRKLYDKYQTTNEYRRILTREIDQAALYAFKNAELNVIGIKNEAVGIYQTRGDWAANLAVQALMFSDKNRKKLDEFIDCDIVTNSESELEKLTVSVSVCDVKIEEIVDDTHLSVG